MAFNKSKLNSIPQRNKDVAFGFCREEEKEWHIPRMIKYLCLLYLNQNKDEFVGDNTRKDIAINGDCITSSTSISSCYLKNIVDKRKHVWKFMINKYILGNSGIGIYNNKFEFRRDTFFDYSAGAGDNNLTGYAMSFDGEKTDLNKSIDSLGRLGCWGEDTGLALYNGNIFEMLLDFNEMKLYGKRARDDTYVELFHIDKGQYRAAVTLVDGSSVSLLSYQELY
eukprot:516737_1